MRPLLSWKKNSEAWLSMWIIQMWLGSNFSSEEAPFHWVSKKKKKSKEGKSRHENNLGPLGNHSVNCHFNCCHLQLGAGIGLTSTPLLSVQFRVLFVKEKDQKHSHFIRTVTNRRPRFTKLENKQLIWFSTQSWRPVKCPSGRERKRQKSFTMKVNC